MIETDSERLKGEVREYWNTRPCGTQFTHLAWGSKEFFDEVERFRYTTQPFMAKVVEFNNFRGKKLLEIGCGLGTDLLQFARGEALVTGIDLAPASIELVKQRFRLYGLPVEAHVADAEQLSFENNSFDVVYSFGVLHHTPNTQMAIDEIYRVVKPGGRVIVMLYHKHSLHVYIGAALCWLRGFVRNRRLTRKTVDEWVRIYDGCDNPLGKAYSKTDARMMFRRFRDISFVSCDPIRRILPAWANALNQSVFAQRLGFWLIIKAAK